MTGISPCWLEYFMTPPSPQFEDRTADLSNLGQQDDSQPTPTDVPFSGLEQRDKTPRKGQNPENSGVSIGFWPMALNTYQTKLEQRTAELSARLTQGSQKSSESARTKPEPP